MFRKLFSNEYCSRLADPCLRISLNVYRQRERNIIFLLCVIKYNHSPPIGPQPRSFNSCSVFPHSDWSSRSFRQIYFDVKPRLFCLLPPFHWPLYSFSLRHWPAGLVVKGPGLHSPFCDCSVECPGQEFLLLLSCFPGERWAAADGQRRTTVPYFTRRRSIPWRWGICVISGEYELPTNLLLQHCRGACCAYVFSSSFFHAPPP